MEILAHRGLWKDENKKNSIQSFQEAFDSGFGVELDVRDCRGNLVVCHDLPFENEIKFEYVLEILEKRNLPLAINIKADGLSIKLEQALHQYEHKNYFLFDMSLPELYFQITKTKLTIYSGQNEFQKNPPLIQCVQGVWLDCFTGTWFGPQLIIDWLNSSKGVAIVSPELHKREHLDMWNMLKENKLHHYSNIMLCTDYPNDAKKFFGI